MKSYIIFLFTVTSFFAQRNEVAYYPSWFLFPKENSVVGYSSIDSSALFNAAKRKAYMDSCIANGELYYYDISESEKLNKHSDYYYYYSEKTFERYYTQLCKRDSFVINVFSNDTIFLFSLTDTTQFDNSLIDIGTLTKPLWVEKNFYEKDNYYYGIGSYTLLGKDNDAWCASEENAIFNIIFSISHRFTSVSINYNDKKNYEYENAKAIQISAKLNNIEVVQRYPDFKDKLYYTLLRIKKTNVNIMN